MEDFSGLKSNDNLARYSDSHNGRLPTNSTEDTPKEEKPFKDVLQEHIDKLEKEPIAIMQEAKVEYIKIDIKIEKA